MLTNDDTQFESILTLLGENRAKVGSIEQQLAEIRGSFSAAILLNDERLRNLEKSTTERITVIERRQQSRQDWLLFAGIVFLAMIAVALWIGVLA